MAPVNKTVFQIVIASKETEGLLLIYTSNWLNESGKLIREYTQVYESKTHRIPVQYIARDFYRFFHLAV
jgi:peptidyl-tRNA hydrolase